MNGMNKNVLWLIAAILLVIGIYLAYRQKQLTKQQLPDDALFAVKDTSNVDKIFIAEKSTGRTATLVKSGQRWRINDKYFVQPSNINLLLETLHDLSVVRPLGESEQNNIVRDLAGSNNKVEIYRKGQLYKTIYVGPEGPNSQDGYFLLEGADQPFIANVPGFAGNVNVRFNADENFWRSRQIFASGPETLEELSISYAGKGPLLNIKKDGNQYLVNGKATTLPEAMVAYLRGYKRVYAMEYLTNYSKQAMDSILHIAPALITIQVKDKDPRWSQTLELVTPVDQDFALGRINNQVDAVSISSETLKRLLELPKRPN